MRDMVTKNHKKLYSFIKGKRSDSTGISPLKYDGVTHNDPSKKATILNKQFTGVFTTEDTTNVPAMDGDSYSDTPHFTVEAEGVQKLLLNPNTHKASGPDNIPTQFLKDFAEVITPALTLLFNASLQQGTVPSAWKKANVSSSRKATAATPLTTDPSSLHQFAAKS